MPFLSSGRLALCRFIHNSFEWGLVGASTRRLTTSPVRHKPLESSLVEGSLGGEHGFPGDSRAEFIDDNLLARAFRYGIRNRHELVRQADIHTPLGGERVFQQSRYRNDFRLWCILLDTQRKLNGDKGVKTIWWALENSAPRHGDYYQGPSADYLWSAFVATGLKDHDFLQKLCVKEMNNGAPRTSLWVDVVGGLLATGQAGPAHQFSSLLRERHHVTLDDVFNVSLRACESASKTALEALCTVQSQLPQTCLYDRIIPYLCERGRFSDAWMVHRHLLDNRDLPQSARSMEPLISNMVAEEIDLERFLKHLKSRDICFENQIRKFYAQERSLQYGVSSENLNVVSSHTFGLRAGKWNDAFVARAFATTTFSVNFVVNSLHVMGLNELGPLALRQVALRSGNASGLRETLESIKRRGIDTGTSVYARIVQKLAQQDEDTLLSNVLASDEHPDVFGDVEVQERLLAQHYRFSDWQQLNKVLFVLKVNASGSIGNDEHSEEVFVLNALLRSALRARNWSGAMKLLARIREQPFRCPLNVATKKVMKDTILSVRQPMKPPNQDPTFDDLGFYIPFLKGAVEAGSGVSPVSWYEPMRRLGQLRRWSELERLVLWLAKQYSHDPANTDNRVIFPSALVTAIQPPKTDGKGKRERGPILERLFPIPLQKALIIWAFYSFQTSRSMGSPRYSCDLGTQQELNDKVNFARGVELLRYLRDTYGLPVTTNTVRVACLQRLRAIFEPGHVFRRVKLETIERARQVPLDFYLRKLDAAWYEPLFPAFPGRRSSIIRTSLLRRSRPRRIRRIGRVERQLFPEEHLVGDLGQLSWNAHDQQSLSNTSADDANSYRVNQLERNASKESKSQDSPDEVVMYRDLFTASWKDYQRNQRTRRKMPRVSLPVIQVP